MIRKLQDLGGSLSRCWSRPKREKKRKSEFKSVWLEEQGEEQRKIKRKEERKRKKESGRSRVHLASLILSFHLRF